MAKKIGTKTRKRVARKKNNRMSTPETLPELAELRRVNCNYSASMDGNTFGTKDFVHEEIDRHLEILRMRLRNQVDRHFA